MKRDKEFIAALQQATAYDLMDESADCVIEAQWEWEFIAGVGGVLTAAFLPLWLLLFKTNNRLATTHHAVDLATAKSTIKAANLRRNIVGFGILLLAAFAVPVIIAWDDLREFLQVSNDALVLAFAAVAVLVISACVSIRRSAAKRLHPDLYDILTRAGLPLRRVRLKRRSPQPSTSANASPLTAAAAADRPSLVEEVRRLQHTEFDVIVEAFSRKTAITQAIPSGAAVLTATWRLPNGHRFTTHHVAESSPMPGLGLIVWVRRWTPLIVVGAVCAWPFVAVGTSVAVATYVLVAVVLAVVAAGLLSGRAMPQDVRDLRKQTKAELVRVSVESYVQA